MGCRILGAPNEDICHRLPNLQMLYKGDPSTVGVQSFGICSTFQKGFHHRYPFLITLLKILQIYFNHNPRCTWLLTFSVWFFWGDTCVAFCICLIFGTFRFCLFADTFVLLNFYKHLILSYGFTSHNCTYVSWRFFCKCRSL